MGFVLTAFFLSLSISFRMLHPFVNYFIPLNKEIIRVRDVENADIDADKHYPVLDFVGLVERYEGYTAETHNVVTQDGYILVLHRITGSPLSPKGPNKPAVYMQIGIGQSSDNFVLYGPERDLAFMLADAGNDVWLGNVRGTAYSMSHQTKSSADDDFWEFSWHEYGVQDLKSFIDKVLLETNQTQLTYIGYSMGTTMSYVLLSTYPEYNDKIRMHHSLSPVAFWKHELRLVTKFFLDWAYKPIMQFSEYFNFKQMINQHPAFAYIGKHYCAEDCFFTHNLCAGLIGFTNKERFDASNLPIMFAHFPAGIPTRIIEHYYQNHITKKFQAYDYGKIKNLIKYKSFNPPKYDVSKITAPMTIWYAENDHVINSEDVRLLIKSLPNVAKVHYFEKNETFDHFDFVWGIKAKGLIYDKLVRMQTAALNGTDSNVLY